MNQLMTRLLLASVEEFVGLAAVIGGVGLVTGGLPVPIEWLVHASFTSYLIPGPLMMLVIGGSMLVATAGMYTRGTGGVLLSLSAGAILVVWIVVQVALLGLRSALELVTIVLGVVITGLAVYLLVNERQTMGNQRQ